MRDLLRSPLARVWVPVLTCAAAVAYIDRADRESAVAALLPVQEAAKKGLSILVAPEGTRLDTNEVGPFKKARGRPPVCPGALLKKTSPANVG